MSNKLLLLFLLVLLVFPLRSTLAARDEQYHLKLLAVQEVNELTGEYKGSSADLYLELRRGTGRVFLETFPLNKFDTQISTRFAKEIACKHYDLDCERYDFIFTITADTSIIGGPSAGAAIAALTTIAVKDLEYDEGVSVTGTINSGAIVGPVAGVKEKIEVAEESGLWKVLIPKGSSHQEISRELNTNQTVSSINQTVNTSLVSVNITEFAKENHSTKVVEVMDLDEVIFHITGRQLNHQIVEVTESEEYRNIMKGLQQVLCDRSKKLIQELEAENVAVNEGVMEEVISQQQMALNATQLGDFYSAASYCFGNNIKLKGQYYQQKNAGQQDMARLFANLNRNVISVEQKLSQEQIETISDLQALMVVKERLSDVRVQIQDFTGNWEELSLEETRDLLAYAEERYFSAFSWMQFFDMEGKKFILDEQRLRRSCLQKISEAQEREQYVAIFMGRYHLGSIGEKIAVARRAYQNKEYALCLITAAQAKADSNTILSSIGLSKDAVPEFLESKSKAVERVIAENSAEGIFPILGYSYYQYAGHLAKEDEYTSLIYLEYALEISDLGIYFPEEQTFFDKVRQRFWIREEWILVGEGFLLGVIVAALVVILRKRLQPSGRKKRKN